MLSRKQPLPRVPLGVELSYARALKAFIRDLRADVLMALRQAGPDILAAAQRVRSDDVSAPPEDFNEPSADGWSARLDALFAALTDRVQERLRFVPPIIRRTARATDAHSIGEWRRQIRAAFGVDITLGNPDLRDMLRAWEANNLSLITRMSGDTVAGLRDVFVRGVIEGESLRSLTAQVRERLDVSEARAELIARTNVGQLNGQLQRARQTAAGVEEYTWHTSGDERVRPTHRARNNRVYRWDGPGIRPGQEIRCRCSGSPVFPATMQVSAGRAA